MTFYFGISVVNFKQTKMGLTRFNTLYTNRGYSRPTLTWVYQFWAHLFRAPKLRKKSQSTKKISKQVQILSFSHLSQSYHQTPLQINRFWGYCPGPHVRGGLKNPFKTPSSKREKYICATTATQIIFLD